MSKIVVISGPSATGKTTLFNELILNKELSNVVFIPDIFSTVWNDMVMKGLFSEYDDIVKDPEFLCVYIQRVIDHYKSCLTKYKDSDDLVLIEGCWLDISVYTWINMWYMHIIREIQEGLLYQLGEYDTSISRIYITRYDETKVKSSKFRSPFKRYNVKNNRSLELQYYRLFSNFRDTIYLPTSDVDQSVSFILNDLKNLGYL